MLSNMHAFLNDFDPDTIVINIAQRAKKLRLSQNTTQALLAEKSGVSLGSLKRFEHTGEISMHNLVRLAVALNATDVFMQLFSTPIFKSVDEVLQLKKTSTRKRARIKK